MEILKRLKVLVSKCGTAKTIDTKHFKCVGVEYEYNGKKLKFDELPKEEQLRILKLQMQNIRSIAIPCIFTLDEQNSIQDNCNSKLVLKEQDGGIGTFIKANTKKYFKELSFDEIRDLLSQSKYSKTITFYYIDKDGSENVISSRNDSFPFWHKDDIYFEDSTTILPKGSFQKLGFDLKPLQVLGLVDTTGEYVLSYTCTEKVTDEEF